jgi:hypothetical protein
MFSITFIAAVLIVGCLALILTALDSTLLTDDQAEAKGQQLLLDQLTPAQRLQYLSKGYFDVVGSTTGKRYRIYRGTQQNVREVLATGRAGGGKCFMPRGGLVSGDCMLAQKIALENCEEEVLRRALPF